MSSEVHALPDNNNVTALDYSAEASMLAVGDSQGKVHLFTVQHVLSDLLSFPSHHDVVESESQHSENKAICSVRYLYSLPKAAVLLVTNEKTVKLWRVKPHSYTKPSCRRSYLQGHRCCIHSLSVCSSKQHFLTADDLRINLWDLEHETAYTLADFAPNKISLLREVLLSACFHPTDPSLLLFSSTTGKVRVADLRLRASALPAAIELQAHGEDYCEITSSVTGADFSDTSPLVFARDLLRVNIWDLRQRTEPVSTVPIFTHFSECEVSKFQVKSCGESFVTGGKNSVVVKGSSHAPPLKTALGLGPCLLSTVTCDPQGIQVFAAAFNKFVVAMTENQNLASF